MTVHTECPHMGDFDPGKAPDVYDPWPTLAVARDERPVFFLPCRRSIGMSSRSILLPCS